MASVIAVIGCGNLGRSLVEGLLLAGYPPDRLRVTRRNPESLEDLVRRGVAVGSDNRAAIADAHLILLAVKPYNALDLLAEIADMLNPEQLVASAVASVHLNSLQGAAGSASVARIMPNTASAIGESMTCYAHAGLTAEHRDRLVSLLEHLGLALEIDEHLMEAATVLGACGIAFVMRFMRAFVQAGVQIGFDANTAATIVNQTVRGASGLLAETGQHPEQEIDKVTTPRGCTIVGLNEMEHAGFSSSLIKGIVASNQKIEG